MSAGPSGVCLRCFMCSVPMCGPNMWYQKDTQRSSSGELTVGLTSRATSVSWWPVASETEVARLVSPTVSSPDDDLCVSFWYHMFGPHIGTLHMKQRKQTPDGPADILLWTVSGHQGNRWREGRVLIPHSNRPYQGCLHHFDPARRG
ncbi:hypothetical protein CRUP_032115 [Coryphaenoides rupestris]|nr:hypothetical protein CRUP_032115 [Coryphaenoides rupestris]